QERERYLLLKDQRMGQSNRTSLLDNLLREQQKRIQAYERQITKLRKGGSKAPKVTGRSSDVTSSSNIQGADWPADDEERKVIFAPKN
ncbi:MAG: hypothetical protein AAF709_12140, partial [Pseudomonadota bacterium]